MRAFRILSRSNSIPAKTTSIFKNTLSYAQPSHETHFVSLIHASKKPQHLQQIHAQIILHSLTSNSRIITQFISSCSLHKSVIYASSIFRQFDDPSLFVFNALIRALAENSQFESSISYFVLMLRSNIRPDRLTLPYVLKSVAGLVDCELGRVIHGVIAKIGIEFDSFVRVSLVDMYVKVELLGCALQVFDESPERNKLGSILLWNVLMNGCCKVGDLRKARELFDAMPVRNVGSWNSLINGFMRDGEVDRARELFDCMPEKNVVSWTTMVTGYSQNGHHEKALSMFSQILEVGVKPNDLTVVSALSACAKVGALEAGVHIHKYLSSNGFQLNKAIGTALVDMYAKCGNVESASRVFGMTKEKDLRTWSVMIWGWAIHGCFQQAFEYFDKMKSKGFKPDGVVFLAILTACSHSGQVDKGLSFFESMKLDYAIEPTMKHYALIVDLLGRAGRLDEALSFIKNMPLDPDMVIWGALFCACRAHKNTEMAELTSESVLQLEPKHPGGYVFLSNIYAGAGRWEDVERVRNLMKNRGAEKDPGWSCIEVDGHVHSFVAGDHAHEHTAEIYQKLEEITRSARKQGYTPETEWVLHNIEEEEKEDALGSHSEKLALAFALISTSPKTTIRIVKNLRVCGDCHSMMKYVSRMNEREIILRDIKRFHHFKDGICSCGDYW
ncbi:pentatricopeptide repeat-containing protein At1g04840-like [Actinidia eriantha]|uniref:pentatricopeptide repeat-containing protein At1g04840-like n=1 Tax=Actinidia eriantha TaxID=165200 RepID=UPI00258E13AC|nr:pentatricopeptide repeat-containing protein At1g04840-like [Actinidia eriantha]